SFPLLNGQNVAEPKRFWLEAYGGMSDLGQYYNEPGRVFEAGAYLNPGFWILGGRMAGISTKSVRQPGESAFDFQFMTGLCTPSYVPVRLSILGGIGISAMQLYDNLEKAKDNSYHGDDKYTSSNVNALCLPLSFQLQF